MIKSNLLKLEWWKWKIYCLLRFKIGVPLYRLIINCNPKHEFELNISFRTDNVNMFELTASFDEMMKILGLLDSGSGYGCGVRDLHYIGSRNKVINARIYVNNIIVAFPKYDISATDEIEDADYLGIGY
jgi:hypothetical protein